MLPIVEVPESIRIGMQAYRDVFCRDEGFEHISRYVTGLIISPNKTLQGIHDVQSLPPRNRGSMRASATSIARATWILRKPLSSMGVGMISTPDTSSRSYPRRDTKKLEGGKDWPARNQGDSPNAFTENGIAAQSSAGPWLQRHVWRVVHPQPTSMSCWRI